MKKITLALLLLAFTTIFAQDKKSLEQRSQTMVEVTYKANYDAVLDYTYPKIFDIAPREALKEALEKVFNSEEFSIKLVNVAPNFKFSDIKKIDGGYYSLVDYDMVMEMKFSEPVEEAEMMVDIFKSGMKAEEVTFNESTNTFIIKKRSQMVAINDAVSKNQWTFINNDSGELMNRLLSEKVIKELGL